MKKIMSITLLALVALALPLSLVGCGNSKEAKLIGSWITVSERYLNNDGTIESVELEETTTVTFLKNHKCSANGKVLNEYSWRVEGDHYILRREYPDGDVKESNVTITNGKLIIKTPIYSENRTIEVTYERVK